MTEKYLLLYRKPENKDWKTSAFSEVIKVGSNSQNDLVLSDGGLSSIHFELRENPTGIYLKDVDAEAGETILNGDSLATNRPTAIELDQVFQAGQYEFQITLNLDEGDEPSTIQQLISTIKDFGLWKTVGIGVAVIAVALIGALLIYNMVIKKPMEIADMAATEVVGAAQDVIEAATTLVPTELFELSSTAVVEAVDALVTAPGMGDFAMQEMVMDISNMDINDLMSFAMNPDELINLATTITGDNVGYIFAYSGIHKDGKVITTGMSFVEAESSEVVDGVEIPEWNESEIPVEILWEPIVHYLEDGSGKAIALLQPTVYGAAEGEQVYWVEGIYQQQTSSDQFSALARFGEDGKMIDILTFGKIGSERQTPYKVNYKAGDTFTPYEMEFIHDPEATEEMAMDLTNGSLPLGWSQLLQMAMGGTNDGSFQFGIGEFERHPGTQLTLNDEGLVWTVEEMPQGDFVAGIAIEDLDNNMFVGYIPILVKP